MKNLKDIKARTDIPTEATWDLTKIYISDEDWEKDFEIVKSLSPTITQFKGKLSSIDSLKEFIKQDEKISRLMYKLQVYASLKNNEDTTNTKYQNMVSKISDLYYLYTDYTSFVSNEILDLGLNKILGYLEDPSLSIYKMSLLSHFEYKDHILSEKEESLLAKVSESFSTPCDVYNSLTNSDMVFGKIKDENGNVVEVTEANYNALISSKDRLVRKKAFKTLLSGYEQHKNTFASLLYSQIKNDSNWAKLRKFSSSLESALKPDRIPVSVYESALDAIEKNKSYIHRYIDLKKKLLGVRKIHMYDIYAPLFDTPEKEFSFEEAIDIINKGLAPLGQDYLSILNNGVKDRWIDIYPSKGKCSGAYSSGSYDTMPYILMNYVGTLSDVFTLAHELGHSMHSYYSNKNQPFELSSYSMFNAEVASTTNEILLINHLINTASSKEMKLFLINHEMEQIRTTVIRQLMFAEFEKITHDIVDNEQPLSNSEFCSIWRELHIKYFGEDIVIDDEILVEWARIPHFYTSFYVYQYATGYAAATMFATDILNGKENSLENYKKFLKAGGSDYSIEVLKKSGVDMTTEEPINAVINRFNYLLTLLENELSK